MMVLNVYSISFYGELKFLHSKHLGEAVARGKQTFVVVVCNANVFHKLALSS